VTDGSFFVPRGPGFAATALTRGPWDARFMHGGPPAALLGRAFERLAGEAQLVRLTFEFVRPLVAGDVDVEAAVVRPGRKVVIVAGALVAGGQEIVRASALAIRRREVDVVQPASRLADVAAPESLDPWEFPFFAESTGYHTGMEVRVARGRFGSGALTGWMRMRVPLLPDEEPSPLQRVLCAADSGNGLSVALDLARFTFLNPDLVVSLHRLPEGEWVGLDATTTPEPHGIGLAESALFDRHGAIGRALQTLIIEPRP
jgi:hypothetical protein